MVDSLICSLLTSIVTMVFKDSRLYNYLFEQDYIRSYIKGGIASEDDHPKGVPLVINGRLVFDMTLEEFKEWESLHGVEGDGGLDEGEGGDG